ncbi:Peptidase A1 [Macleaya cordata]|uniref:Peptidase A1 n=1 Tax=Macleaya cordata TaxID=56857 RepID=A0A200Q9F9_MACCD|nr:Peptidase A1 [Macleaya cordata]
MASSSSSSSVLICLLSLLSLSSFISSSTIVIPLQQQHFTQTPSSNPWQILNNLASTSLTRAKHIKNPRKTHLSKTQLFPQSYGGYTVSLSFGTPPQTIPFVMDTGSDLVWFPCTDHYICRNCSFSNSNSNEITSYKPKLSSSVKLIGCQNTKCSWIHHSDVQSRCQDCTPNSKNCTQICPPYLLLYGSGSTAGLLLSETLNLNGKKVPNFAVGCSRFSLHIPTGIAGFGRGSPSLPNQLGLSKFSYCLLSHRFDNTKKSTQLVLYSGSDSGDKKTTGVSYTPFIKNPVDRKPEFSVYYYVGLRKITVGGKKVKIPYNFLALGSDGNGGTVVDSGSTFTFMEGRIFELVASEIENQVAHYRRASDVEASSGLKPCFQLPKNDEEISLPKLSFHFKGGAEMDLPLANYFSFVGNTKVVCLTIVTNSADSAGVSDGPSIILGNFQQQNYYVEYDLKNERFGFRQQTCK